MKHDIISINGVEITHDQLHEIIARRIWKHSEVVTTVEATEEVANLLVETFATFSVNVDPYPDPEWLSRNDLPE